MKALVTVAIILTVLVAITLSYLLPGPQAMKDVEDERDRILNTKPPFRILCAGKIPEDFVDDSVTAHIIFYNDSVYVKLINKRLLDASNTR